MKITKILMAAFAIFALIATANTAYAQTVQATGTVLEPITFTSSTNLAFGTSIFPGINESVAPDNASASQFDIDGETGKEVTLNFTLPEVLDHDTDGSSTLTISFATTDGVHNTASDVAGTGATEFDPSVEQTTNLGGTDGLLYVWLGGTVEPANNQAEGSYAGDITLDVAYTGQ